VAEGGRRRAGGGGLPAAALDVAYARGGERQAASLGAAGRMARGGRRIGSGGKGFRGNRWSCHAGVGAD